MPKTYQIQIENEVFDLSKNEIVTLLQPHSVKMVEKIAKQGGEIKFTRNNVKPELRKLIFKDK